MGSNDDAPRPAPAGGGPPNRGKGPTSASGSGDDPEPDDRAIYFGNFKVVAKIGGGHTGAVFQALCERRNRVVALKLFSPAQLASPATVRQFLTNLRAAADVRHPGLVSVYDVGEHEGCHFVVMDYVNGRSLAQLAGGAPLPAQRSAAYLSTIAAAVHYAHCSGVLHERLTSDRILIDESDCPRVTGFGMIIPFDLDVQDAVDETWARKYCFVAPEQVAGDKGRIGPATDVYALGAILYELATGQPPFLGKPSIDVRFQVLHTQSEPPRTLNPTVPRDLEAICLKCLRKDPARRYATAGELAEDLNRFLRAEPIRTPPQGRFEKAWRWCRRRLPLRLS